MQIYVSGTSGKYCFFIKTERVKPGNFIAATLVSINVIDLQHRLLSKDRPCLSNMPVHLVWVKKCCYYSVRGDIYQCMRDIPIQDVIIEEIKTLNEAGNKTWGFIGEITVKSMKILKYIVVILLLGVATYFAVKKYYFHPTVYPLKSSFFEWAGDTKILESSPNTISNNELNRMRRLMKPGDIFLIHSDYYISNVGIPGFWTHAGLYVGDRNERNDFFANDKACMEWVMDQGEISGDFEKLLLKDYKVSYQFQVNDLGDFNIIEALSEGVVISSFEAGAKKEGIVILRPLLGKSEIAAAIYTAFSEVSKPYDYNFDFSTDNTIACTELVYKVYESSLLFPVNDMFGKPFSTANEIAEYCNKKYDSNELKLGLIYIYDGNRGYMTEQDTAHAIFRKSWNESMW